MAARFPQQPAQANPTGQPTSSGACGCTSATIPATTAPIYSGGGYSGASDWSFSKGSGGFGYDQRYDPYDFGDIGQAISALSASSSSIGQDLMGASSMWAPRSPAATGSTWSSDHFTTLPSSDIYPGLGGAGYLGGRSETLPAAIGAGKRDRGALQAAQGAAHSQPLPPWSDQYQAKNTPSGFLGQGGYSIPGSSGAAQPPIGIMQKDRSRSRDPRAAAQQSHVGAAQQDPRSAAQYDLWGAARQDPLDVNRQEFWGRSIQQDPRGAAQQDSWGRPIRHDPQDAAQYPRGAAQQDPQGAAQQYPQGAAQQYPQGAAQQYPRGAAQQYSRGAAQQYPRGAAQDPRSAAQQEPCGAVQQDPWELQDPWGNSLQEYAMQSLSPAQGTDYPSSSSKQFPSQQAPQLQQPSPPQYAMPPLQQVQPPTHADQHSRYASLSPSRLPSPFRGDQDVRGRTPSPQQHRPPPQQTYNPPPTLPSPSADADLGTRPKTYPPHKLPAAPGGNGGNGGGGGSDGDEIDPYDIRDIIPVLGTGAINYVPPAFIKYIESRSN